MRETKYITIISNRKKIELNTSTILYINMMGKYAVIHVAGGGIYETRMTLDGLEKQLGEGFIKIHRGCIVAVMAIHDINDRKNIEAITAALINFLLHLQILKWYLMKKAMLSTGYSGMETRHWQGWKGYRWSI